MDKYEYKVRADEIRELIAQEEYAMAAEIADTIDWRRVKSVMMLCTISDLYKINRRYEDARDILLLAYDRRPGGRTICYSLCELSIKMEEYVHAVEYYKEFVQVAPKDSGRYILQYKLYEAQDVSLEERIEVLEELKKRDYREKWAYELAYLYHRVGLATRCVEECDEMILWFGEGKYVIKAMELKKLHEPLTPAQEEKYNNRFGVFAVQENVQTPDTYNEEVNVQALGDTKVYGPIRQEMVQQSIEQEVTELDNLVKTMDVGEYNTMNLQAELAAGLREVLGEESVQDPIMRSLVAPMLESDTESLDYPQIDEVSEEDLELVAEEIESSEVFFGETGEIIDRNQNEQILKEIILEQPMTDATAEIVMKQMRQEETGEARDTMWNAEPPKELAGVLSQESDGQISLVMPEAENIEKQITGQMSIEDILAEWERMKKENEEKRKEEVRRHVLLQTGTMFTEFEAAVRDGLLEQLENSEIEGKEAVEDDLVEELTEIAEEEYAGEISEYIEEESVEGVAEVAEEDQFEEIAEKNEAEDSAEEDADFETEDVVWDVREEVAEELSEGIMEAQLISEEIAEVSTAEEEPVQEPEEVEEATTAEEEPAQELEEVEEATTVEEEPAQEPEEVEEATIVEKEPAQESEEVEEATTVEEKPTREVESETVPEKPAVVRDKAKVRMLTREERELYAPFVQSRSAREQLVQAIDNISLAAYTGNIIITGDGGMDTLTLAKNMIREVQMTDSNFSGQVAKISGNALNQKDVSNIVKDLKNGALIIQKAAEMNTKTVGALNKILQQEDIGIIVVLLDTKRAINLFLAEHKELQSCFTARMDVEALSNDTLVAFGKQYAKEREYSIDEMGVLALHTKIENMQTSDHIVTVVEVKEIVDEAIRHANKKTVKHFFDILFARRYDDEDMVILNEKDFV